MAIENIERLDQLQSIRNSIRCIEDDIKSLIDKQNESDTLVMSRDKYEKESKQKDIVLERLLTLIASIYSKFESDGAIVRLIDDTREDLEQDGIHLKYYKRGDSDVDMVENLNCKPKETNEPSMDGKVEMFRFGLSFENLEFRNNIEPIVNRYEYNQSCEDSSRQILTENSSPQDSISNFDTKMNKSSEKTKVYKHSFGVFDKEYPKYIVLYPGLKFTIIDRYDVKDNVYEAKESERELSKGVEEILGSICTKYKLLNPNTIKEESNKEIEACKFRSTFGESNNKFSQYNVFFIDQHIYQVIKITNYKSKDNICVAKERKLNPITCFEQIVKLFFEKITFIPKKGYGFEEPTKNRITDILKNLLPVEKKDDEMQKGQQKQESQCKKKGKYKNTSNGQSEDAVVWVKVDWGLNDAH